MTEPLLNELQARVLGCLIEKELTTPDYYPLTLNALVSACNQKSNRDPVMSLTPDQVQQALDQLKYKSIVMSVHPHGSRTVKYKHIVKEKLDWIDDEVAILCELMLRGPQTVGELRTRCERLYPFGDLDEVRDTLQRLARKQPPLAVELEREPGQKERRWTHLLAGEPEVSAASDTIAQSAAVPVPDVAAADDVKQEVDALKARVEQLEQQFAEFKAQFE